MAETTEKVYVKGGNAAFGLGLTGSILGGLALVGEALGVLGPRAAAFRNGVNGYAGGFSSFGATGVVEAERITRLEAEQAAGREISSLKTALVEKDIALSNERASFRLAEQEKQIQQLQKMFTLTPALAESAVLV